MPDEEQATELGSELGKPSHQKIAQTKALPRRGVGVQGLHQLNQAVFFLCFYTFLSELSNDGKNCV